MDPDPDRRPGRARRGAEVGPAGVGAHGRGRAARLRPLRPSGALVALRLRTPAAHRRRRPHLRLRHPHHGVGRAVARAAGQRAGVAATAAAPAAHPAGLGGARLTDAGRVGHAGPGEAGRGRAGDRGSRAHRRDELVRRPVRRDRRRARRRRAGLGPRGHRGGLRGLPRHVRVGDARHAVRGHDRTDPPGARLAPVPVPRPLAPRRAAARGMGGRAGRRALRHPARPVGRPGGAALARAAGLRWADPSRSRTPCGARAHRPQCARTPRDVREHGPTLGRDARPLPLRRARGAPARPPRRARPARRTHRLLDLRPARCGAHGGVPARPARRPPRAGAHHRPPRRPARGGAGPPRLRRLPAAARRRPRHHRLRGLGGRAAGRGRRREPVLAGHSFGSIVAAATAVAARPPPRPGAGQPDRDVRARAARRRDPARPCCYHRARRRAARAGRHRPAAQPGRHPDRERRHGAPPGPGAAAVDPRRARPLLRGLRRPPRAAGGVPAPRSRTTSPSSPPHVTVPTLLVAAERDDIAPLAAQRGLGPGSPTRGWSSSPASATSPTTRRPPPSPPRSRSSSCEARSRLPLRHAVGRHDGISRYTAGLVHRARRPAPAHDADQRRAPARPPARRCPGSGSAPRPASASRSWPGRCNRLAPDVVFSPDADHGHAGAATTGCCSRCTTSSTTGTARRRRSSPPRSGCCGGSTTWPGGRSGCC